MMLVHLSIKLNELFNADVGCDSALQLCVSVAWSRQGGGHRKLTDIITHMCTVQMAAL